MRMLRGALCAALAAMVLILLPAGPAAAATIETLLLPFTGDDVVVKITLDDTAAGAGNVLVTAEVLAEPNTGDLRGIFLNVADDSVLADMEISGPLVTGYAIGEVTNLGRGSNMSGGGTPCPCEIGVEIGNPGIGKDDVQLASFVLSNDMQGLDVSLFFDELVGARVTSVGEPDSSRSGSSKLVGTVPVPEPASALMLGLGLLGLGVADFGKRRCR